MDAIILTDEQATTLSREYANGYFLKPYRLGDKWILPVSILQCPHYAEAMEELLKCPIERVAIPQKVENDN
jgi:hypothetical protein